MKINDRFEITQDSRQSVQCWIVTEHFRGQRLDKESGLHVPTHTTKDTYHATLEQACMKVLDKSAGAPTAAAVMECIRFARMDIVAAIERMKAEAEVAL